MHFSSRIGDSRPNAISRAEIAFGSSPTRQLLNASDSNPTRHGLSPARFPGSYDPEPRGPLAAREALAEFLSRDQHRDVDPERLYLVSSTSQAYAWLFKLLCDPGETVASPAPGYPLIESIASLEGVRQLSYRLHYHGRWQLDAGSLARALAEPEERVRGVVVINPNNPTGTYLSQDEHTDVVAMCRDSDVALIADEVFYSYSFGAPPARFAGEQRVLTFALDGLSKQLAAPQAKLAWIEVSGPERDVAEAMGRLDVIADDFLPMSALITENLGELLADVPAQRERVRERTRRNLDSLTARVAADPRSPISVLNTEGGWNALLRFPSTVDEDALVTTLIAQHGITVQPGYFFDMAHSGFVSVSLLLEPVVFDDAVVRLTDAIHDLAGGSVS